MAWSTPTTFTVGQIVTAAQLNAQLRDNLRYLKGLDGAVAIEDNVTIGLSGAAASRLTIQGQVVQQAFLESDQAVDEKQWDLAVSAKLFRFRAVNDAYSAATAALTIARGTGTAISYVAVPQKFAVGTEAAPGGQMGVAGSIGIGASYYGIAPPSNGAIVQGAVGVGYSSPSLMFQIFDGIGGGGGSAGIWSYGLTDGSSHQILPNGSINVRCTYVYMAHPSSSSYYGSGTGGVTLSSSSAISDGVGNTITLTVSAAGALSVQRTAGTSNWDIVLWLLWK